MPSAMTCRLHILALVLLMAGCAHQPLPTRGAESPLIFDPAELDASDAIVVLVPGALASIEIFSPAEAWRRDGYALVYYRFPGLDGLPLDHSLSIEGAAEDIAQFANRHPGKPIRLLGFSTGGPIVLLASRMIETDDVRVVALSPAPPKAGGFGTVFRSGLDVIAASIRAGSLKRDKVWFEYYRTLLFGRAGLADPDLAERSVAIAAEQRERIVLPTGDLSRAHTRALRDWTPPDDLSVEPDAVSFYIGGEDPVFSVKQYRKFAASIGATRIRTYPRGGHLLFLTHPEVFDDMLSFFGE